MPKLTLLISILFFLFIHNHLFSQNRRLNLDSLHNVAKSFQQDSSKALTLIHLAEYYANSKNDSCNYYCEKAESFITKQLNENKTKTSLQSLKKLLARIYYLRGSRTLREGIDISLAENYYQKAYNIYKYADDTLGQSKMLSSISYIHERNGNINRYTSIISQMRQLIAHSKDSVAKSITYKTISGYHVYNGNIDSGIYYMQQALEIDLAQNDYKSIVFCIGSLGINYLKQNNYKKALEYSYKGLDVCNKVDYKKGSMFILLNIGDTYIAMEKYQRSLNFLKLARDISFNQKNVQAEVKTANSLSTAYYNLDKLDSALKYSNQVLNLIKEKHFGKSYESNIYNRISIIYKKRGNLNQAFVYAQKSLETHKSPDLSKKADKLYNLGDLYLKQDQLDLAESLVEQSFNYYNKKNDKKGIMNSSLLLSSIYAKQKKFKTAFNYLKISENIEDSLYTVETEQILAQNETRFNLQKKEFEIENGKSEIALLKKNKQINYYTIIGFILLFISGGLAFLSFSQQKKAKELEARNQIIYHINEIQKLNKKIEALESGDLSLPNSTPTYDINAALDTPLSERELEVLTELSNGLTNKAISEKLFVSVNTVKTHVKSIYTKLDVSNRTQAAKKLKA